MKNAAKIRGASFLVLWRPNGLEHNRLGVTVTKKIGPAVTRNRLKRQVREFFRLRRGRWPQGFDVLFIAQNAAAGTDNALLREELSRLEKKFGVWRPLSAEAAL